MVDLTVSTKPLPNSELEIAGELAAEAFASYRSPALKKLSAKVTVAGFRPGHIPETVLVGQVGEAAVLEKMAELALQARYPQILTAKKIDAVGRPTITITKLAKGNPLGFKIVTAVTPVVTLPDWRHLVKKNPAGKREAVTVSAEEVAKVIAEIDKNKTTESALTADLKEKVKADLLAEKEQAGKDKWRLHTLETISGETPVAIPPVMIDYELDKMIADLKSHLEQVGLKFDQYLEHLKKTEADIRSGWQPEAVKRVHFGLLLQAIAAKEQVAVEEALVKPEVEMILRQYPAAEAPAVAAYVRNRLVNEKVFALFESLQ